MEKYVKQGFLKKESFKTGDLIMFVLTKNEIELEATYRFVQQLVELKKVGVAAKNSVAIMYNGYDNDPREVYQIPEICKYLRKLFAEVPEMFYFINIPSYTFAILLNSVFTSQAEVNRADNAVITYGKSIGDTNVITVSYYAEHHMELIQKYS